MPPAEGKTSPSRFFDRLPPAYRTGLRALEMEDHYVRVHGSSGSTLLLMRMRDAVSELDGVPGMQVHRSWWVARSAVEGHSEDGRAVQLRLVGGLVVPVARNSIQALRDAGWLGSRR